LRPWPQKIPPVRLYPGDNALKLVADKIEAMKAAMLAWESLSLNQLQLTVRGIISGNHAEAVVRKTGRVNAANNDTVIT